MNRKTKNILKKNRNWKRTLAGLMAIIFFLVVVAPVQVSAAPPWWNRFKEIAKADAVGAIGGGLGSDFSWSWPGAIGGAITGSINAGMDDGASGSGWTSEADAALTIGQLHNTGMNHVYAWGEANLMDEDGKVYAWGRNQDSMDMLVDATLEHIRNTGLEVDGTVERTLRGLDPAYEEIMKRIKDALGQGSSGSNSPVSDNFYSNLEQALAILDKEADDPGVLIEESAQFMVEASVKESSPEAVRMAGQLFADDGTLLDTMDIVIVVPGRAGGWLTDEGNNDILLAAVYADVLRASYEYRTYDCDDADSCVLPGLSDIVDPDDDDDGLPDFLDPDDDGDGVPTAMDVEIVLTLDQTRAMVNGEAQVMDTAAFVTEGRTLVPFRFIGEALGATIGWHPDDPQGRKVSYVLGENIVELWIDQSRAMVNGTPTTVDENLTVTPVIVNGRTVVPVRFISEALGAEVDWNGETREVTIAKELDKATPKLFDTLFDTSIVEGGGGGKATFKELTLAKNPDLDTDLPMDLEYNFDILESTIVYLNGQRVEGELLRLKESQEFGNISSLKLGLTEDNMVSEIHLSNKPDSDGDGADDMIESRADIEIDFDISGPPFKFKLTLRIRF